MWFFNDLTCQMPNPYRSWDSTFFSFLSISYYYCLKYYKQYVSFFLYWPPPVFPTPQHHPRHMPSPRLYLTTLSSSEQRSPCSAIRDRSSVGAQPFFVTLNHVFLPPVWGRRQLRIIDEDSTGCSGNQNTKASLLSAAGWNIYPMSTFKHRKYTKVNFPALEAVSVWKILCQIV